jgi:hypothetical protein
LRSQRWREISRTIAAAPAVATLRYLPKKEGNDLNTSEIPAMSLSGVLNGGPELISMMLLEAPEVTE